jgi:aryl-alcohol dehydrogenase
MTQAQAAVLRADINTFSIETVDLEDPRQGEVLVKIVATGICHSDMVLRDAKITKRPIVLGHEGAGIVTRVGAGVCEFKAGDRVAMSFAACGSCPSCQTSAPAYCAQFFPLNYFGSRLDGSTSISNAGERIGSHIFGQSSFATYAVCPAQNLVKVDDDISLEIAGPFGCGFQTGAGSVLNSLSVPRGASVMVLGAGAVGLSAVMAAAHIASAATVIAVDLHDTRLNLAMSVGASHKINGGAEHLEELVKAICPAGVDYIIDTTAYVPLAQRCVNLLASQGTMALVAAYPLDVKFNFDVSMFMATGRKIQGVMEGDSDIKEFIPRLLEHYKQGRFPVDRIIKYYDFADINQAIKDSERGTTIKAIIKMPA